ncbi:hypothetical protein GCM10025856_18030 [Methylophaga marina]|uniref:Uncharacterized protein n=1 Tax=Methylophaga marina TaxID=45495 RepID=A0ABP3DME8_9GAMM|nr:hypothetical protein GCM10025856_18030 [Methylophaga marina]
MGHKFDISSHSYLTVVNLQFAEMIIQLKSSLACNTKMGYLRVHYNYKIIQV